MHHVLAVSLLAAAWACALGALASIDPSSYVMRGGDDELQQLLSPRDTEQLPHSSLWGHKYVAGGAGEGQQFLQPAGTIPNRAEVKTDAILPAYCDPPNPCPPGMNAEDGCAEDFENTAEFSRQYQNRQQCMCDEEHMFSCPQNQHKLTAEQDNSQATFADVLESFLAKQNIVDQHKGVRAKKFRENKRNTAAGGNPYMEGDHRVHIVAKKG